jgi:phosphatidylserine/phosphatidylglycerophosphate/cardiolipin synthase-like enzyme
VIRKVTGRGKTRRRREIWFSPEDDVQSMLLTAVARAERSIDLLIYGFTLDALAHLIMAKAKTGVRCRVVVDRSQAGGSGSAPLLVALRTAGIEVITTTSGKGGIMHEKVALIEVAALGATSPVTDVLYGSYNFSEAAAKQTNHLQIDNDPDICQQYWLRCEALAAHGRDNVKQQLATRGGADGR